MKDMPALLLASVSRRDPKIDGSGVRSRDRLAADASDVRADRALGRHGPQVARVGAQAVRASLAGPADRRGALRRVGRERAVARRRGQDGASEAGDARARGAVRLPDGPRRWLAEALPALVQQFEAFKAGDRREVPDVPFQMLTAAGSEPARVVRGCAPRFVADDPDEPEHVRAARRVRRAGDDGATSPRVCATRRRSLGRGCSRISCWPRTARSTAPCRARCETRSKTRWRSRSRTSRASTARSTSVRTSRDRCGRRSPDIGQGATTAVRCVDVAALVAAAIVRKNPTAEVLPFEESVVPLRLSPRDSVMTNAERLASIGGGGTCVSAPLARAQRASSATGDLVVIVSDNESWVDAAGAVERQRCASGASSARAIRGPGWCSSTSSRPRRPRPPSARTSSTWADSRIRCSTFWPSLRRAACTATTGSAQIESVAL